MYVLIQKFQNLIRNVVSKLRDYANLTDLTPILRRYIILGVFDGVLITLSTIVTSYITNVNPEITWKIGLSCLIGVVFASTWNTIQAEWFERTSEIKKLEKLMFRKLRGTIIDKAHKISAIICIIAHALSPLVGLIPLTLYTYLRYYGPDLSIEFAIISTITILVVLGLLYSKEFGLKQCLKTSLFMSTAGIGVILVCAILFTPH